MRTGFSAALSRVVRTLICAGACFVAEQDGVAAPEQVDTSAESAEQAASRARAVDTLRFPGEEQMTKTELLERLGHMPRRPAGPEVGRFELSLMDAQGSPLALDGWLSFETEDGKDHGCFHFTLGAGIAPVRAGRATVVLRGEERRVTLFSEGLPGYAFARKDQYGRKSVRLTLNLAAGEATASVAVPLEPAGALRWRVVDEAGRPETAQVTYQLQAEDYGEGGSSGPSYDQFLIRPARFGSKYRLLVQKGARVALSEAPVLTPENLVWDGVIAFPPGETITGRVVDADGTPVSGGEVELGYAKLRPWPGGSEKREVATTDVAGGFSFANVNREAPDSYWLVFTPVAGTRGVSALPMHRVTLDARTSLPLEIRLPQAFPAEGVLLHHQTGQPVSGVQVGVYVRPGVSPEGRPEGPFMFTVSAEAPTDEAGRFRFAALPAGVYDLHAPGGYVV